MGIRYPGWIICGTSTRRKPIRKHDSVRETTCSENGGQWESRENGNVHTERVESARELTKARDSWKSASFHIFGTIWRRCGQVIRSPILHALVSRSVVGETGRRCTLAAPPSLGDYPSATAGLFRHYFPVLPPGGSVAPRSSAEQCNRTISLFHLIPAKQ